MSFHEATLQSKPTLESERTGRPGQGNLNDATVLNNARREAGSVQAGLITAENKRRGGNKVQSVQADSAILTKGSNKLRDLRVDFAQQTAPQLLAEDRFRGKSEPIVFAGV